MIRARRGPSQRRSTRAGGRLLVALAVVVGALAGPGVRVAEAAVGPVSVSIGSASVTEGDAGTRRVFFAVTLSRARNAASSVAYSTVAGTAQAGTDFVATAGTVSFPAGTTSATVSVLVKGNTSVNAAARAFAVQLSTPVGVVLGQASAVGTIRDDDGRPHGGVSIGSASVVAGSAETRIAFSVTLSNPAAGGVSVAYTTKPATAKAGTDFIAASGRLRIAAGSRSASLAVRIARNGGTRGGPVETFTVRISAPVGASIDRAVGTGTVRRNGYGTAKAWPNRGGDAGLTASSPHEVTLDADNLADVDRIWTVPACCVERGTSPVSDGTSLFFVQRVPAFPSTAGRVTAYDLATGAVRWSVAAAQDDAQWNLAVGDGIVVAVGDCEPTGFTCLRGYHASDGTVAWRSMLGPSSYTSTPTIADGIVYIGTSFGVSAHDLATGAGLSGFPNDWDYQAAIAGGRIFRGEWVYSVGGQQKVWYAAHPTAPRSATATEVYAFDDNELFAWNAATGASRWTAPINCSSTSQPAVGGDIVVVQACGTVRAYHRSDGTVAWTHAVSQPADFQAAIANGLVYVSDETTGLTVLDADTGALVRTIDLGTNELRGSPIVVDGRIVVNGAALEVFGL